MSNSPLVSVVIPVYNGEKFLKEALESVFVQTYSPIEIIVVDDGSTDRSGEIAQSYSEVKYLHQSNQGVSAARNKAIEMAKGEFIAFLDADDKWQPEKLSLQIKYMASNPGIRITGTKAKNFLEPGTEMPQWIQDASAWSEVNHMIPSTMVVHKSVFEQIGGFSREYLSGEDTEWVVRAMEANISSFIIDEVCTLRRYHGSNLSWRSGSNKTLTLRILKESIDRKSGKA